jgi:hypothetical protein
MDYHSSRILREDFENDTIVCKLSTVSERKVNLTKTKQQELNMEIPTMKRVTKKRNRMVVLSSDDSEDEKTSISIPKPEVTTQKTYKRQSATLSSAMSTLTMTTSSEKTSSTTDERMTAPHNGEMPREEKKTQKGSRLNLPDGVYIGEINLKKEPHGTAPRLPI